MKTWGRAFRELLRGVTSSVTCAACRHRVADATVSGRICQDFGMEYVVAAVILLVVLVVGAVGLVVPRMRRRDLPPPPAGGTTTLERPPTAPPAEVSGEAPTAPPIRVPHVPDTELPPLIETPV